MQLPAFGNRYSHTAYRKLGDPSMHRKPQFLTGLLAAQYVLESSLPFHLGTYIHYPETRFLVQEKYRLAVSIALQAYLDPI